MQIFYSIGGILQDRIPSTKSLYFQGISLKKLITLRCIWFSYKITRYLTTCSWKAKDKIFIKNLKGHSPEENPRYELDRLECCVLTLIIRKMKWLEHQDAVNFRMPERWCAPCVPEPTPVTGTWLGQQVRLAIPQSGCCHCGITLWFAGEYAWEADVQGFSEKVSVLMRKTEITRREEWGNGINIP